MDIRVDRQTDRQRCFLATKKRCGFCLEEDRQTHEFAIWYAKKSLEWKLRQGQSNDEKWWFMTFQTHLNPLSLKLVKLSTCFAEVWWKTATKLCKKHGKKLQLIADSKGWQMSLLAILKHFWERNSKTPLDISLEQKKNALNNVCESLEVSLINMSDNRCSLLEAE